MFVASTVTLRLKKLRIVTLIFLCALFGAYTTSAQSTSWTGATSTDWKIATNWTNGVPSAGVDVVIGDANYTTTRIPTVGDVAFCKSLTIGGAVAARVILKKNLTISGNLLINNNGILDHRGVTITIKGNWTNFGSYLISGTAIASFSGSSQTIGGNASIFSKIIINAGATVTLANNITTTNSLNVTGTFNPGENPVYQVAGNKNIKLNSGGVLHVTAATIAGNYNTSAITVGAGSTVNYSATLIDQTVSSTYTYYTLIISGSGVKSLSANLPALKSDNATTGNIYVKSATFDLKTFTANRSNNNGGVISVSNNALLRIGGTNTFPTNYVTKSLSLVSTVEYYGTAQTITSFTYGNLLLTSSSGAVTKTTSATSFIIDGNLTTSIGAGSGVTFTPSANITVNGITTIGTSCIFNAGTFTHTLAGNFINEGTLNGNTSTILLKGSGSIISGAGAQNFNNLTITGSNITASSVNITVAGNLSTTGSGTFTHNIGGTLLLTGTTKTVSGLGFIVDNLTVSGSVTTTSTLVVNGNISVAGSLTASAGSVKMQGAAKTISGVGSIGLYALIIPGSVTSAKSFSISNALDVSGSFSASAGTVTFTSTATLNGTANLFDVNLNGTTLILSTNSILGVANAFTVTAGTLNVTAAIPNTVQFNGSGSQTIPGISYHRLLLTNGNTKTASGAITTNGTFTIGAATTFNAATFTHTVNSNFVNSGTFTAGTSNMTFAGVTDNTITGATTFNTITINKTTSVNGITLASNVSAATVAMTSGFINTAANTITITTTRSGNGIIWGNINRTHTFTAGVAYAFESPENSIIFASVSGVSTITVAVTPTTIADFPYGSAVNRLYDINIPSGTYNATLRLHYEEVELNGSTESTMVMYNYVASTWSTIGKLGNNATTNYVEQSGITNLSRKYCMANLPNVLRWNGSVSNAWNTPANWTLIEGTPGSIPTAQDIVQIGQQAITNQPVITTAATAKNIDFGSVAAASLTLNAGGSLTVSGNISGSWSAARVHNINVNAQTLTVTGNIVLSDGAAGNAININATTANISVAGNLVQSGGANISFTGAANLNIGGNYTYVSGNFTPGTSTVNYNGTVAQSLAGVTYYNLTTSKTTGIASITQPLSVNNIMAITAGEVSVFANTTVYGNLNVSAGAKIRLSSITLTMYGDLNNGGTFIPGSGTIIFTGSANQSVSLATFYNLIINKPVGTASLTGNIDIYGDFSIIGGNFSLGTFTTNRTSLGGTFTLGANTGLLVGGANNFPSNYVTNTLDSTSTVTYNGSVAQTVNGITYGSLIFSNEAINAKSLAGTITLYRDLTINSGATLNAGMYSINLNGNWTNSGTFTPSTGDVILNGLGKTITGNTIFNRLTVNGNYTVTGTNITCNDLLYVSPTGTLAAGSGTATLNGDFTNSGTVTSTGITTFSGTTLQTIRLVGALLSSSSGIVNFNGTVSPVLNSNSTPSFATLNINNTGGVFPSVGWNVFVAMNVATGATFNGGESQHNFYGSFTNNGSVVSDGILNFSTSIARIYKLAGTNFSSNGTVIFAGTGAITFTGNPTTLTNVTISNTAGVSPPAGWTMGGDFTVNNNGIFNAGSFSYTVGGDFASSGTFNGGTSTFTLSSPNGLISGSDGTTFYDLVISGVIAASADFNVARNFTNNNAFDATNGVPTFTGSLPSIITGTAVPFNLAQIHVAKSNGIAVTLNKNISSVTAIDVLSGTFEASTFTITQDGAVDADNLLSVRDGATFSVAGNNSIPTFTSYIFDSLSTVEFAGVTQTITAVAPYGNLTISTAGTKTAAAALTIQNNFSLANGTFVAGSFTHNISGAWTMSSGVFTNTGSTINFNGSANQSVSSTGSFLNVVVNKSGGVVDLLSNITVAGTLTFTLGNIRTNAFKVIANGTVSGAAQTTGWVAGNLQKNVASGTNVTNTYQVGTTSFYSPATVLMASVSLANPLTVGATISDHPDINNSPLEVTRSVNQYWTIANGGVTFTNATLTFNWNAASLDAGVTNSSLQVGLYNGSWTRPTVANPSGLSIQTTGVTSFGDFVVAENKCSRGIWTGSSSTTWSVADNWSCSVVPDSSIDVSINSGSSRYPIISSTAAVKNLTLQSGGSLVVSNASLEIFGSIANAGTFTASAGTITMKGTSAQTIPANTFATNTIKELTINNSVGVTLGGTLNISELLTVSRGVLTTGNFLILKSSVAGTAQVAPITSAAATPIVGDVTVERYIPGRRKYRLITSSVTTSASSVLSAGQEARSIWGNWQSSGSTATQNIGTSITGGTLANGFDQISTGSSLFNYDHIARRYVSHSSANGKNTNYTPLKAGVAYYMFVYGDRQNSASASAPRPTVLSSTGTLLTGTQTYTRNSTIPLNDSAGRYTLIGNPYVAIVDWDAVERTNVSASMWGWDPNLGGTGGYVTVTSTGGGVIVSPNSGLVQVGRYIQPGQGFFVLASATNPQLTFRETHKLVNRTNLNNQIFRSGAVEPKLLSVNLLFSSAGSFALADGAVATFDSSYSNRVSETDATKMEITTSTESVSFLNSGKTLSIEARELPTQNDTLYLNTLRMTKPQYTLQIFTNNLSGNNLQPILLDTYLNLSIPLQVADTNMINFNVIAGDAASSAAGRFRIVFQPMTTLPVSFVNVSAVAKGNANQVDWTVHTETGTRRYEVMRSADGINFQKAGEVALRPSSGQNTYQWIDNTPATGANYYRISAIQTSGNTVFSKVLLVKNEGSIQAQKIQVYPNPVKDQQLNVQFKNIEKGTFTCIIINSTGHPVFTRILEHQGGTSEKLISFKNKIPAGLYYLRIFYNNETHVQSVLID